MSPRRPEPLFPSHVACPWCWAAAGEPCTNPNRKPHKTFHAARVRAARERGEKS